MGKEARKNLYIIWGSFDKELVHSFLLKNKDQDCAFFVHKSSPEIVLHALEELNFDTQKMWFTAAMSCEEEKKAGDIYLDIIHSIPTLRSVQGLEVNEILTYEREINLYWLMNQTEKNIWGADLLDQIAALLRLEKILKQYSFENINVFSTCPNFNMALEKMIQNSSPTSSLIFAYETFYQASFWKSFLSSIIKEMGKVAIKKYLILKNGIIKRKITPKKISLVTLFPVWWLTKGKGFEEIFFRDHLLPFENENELTKIVIFHDWKGISPKIKQFKKLLSDKNTVLIDERVSLRDIGHLLDPRFYLKLHSFLKTIDHNRNQFCYQGIDLYPVVYQDIKNGICSGAFLWALMIKHTFDRLKFPSKSITIFRLEFQSYEKAVLYSLKQRSMTIGLQHSAIGHSFYNYLFPKDWFSQFSSLRPDRFYVTGSWAKKIFVEAGVKEEDVNIVGPVRFGPIFSYRENGQMQKKLRAQFDLRDDEFVIFFPFSIFVHEAYTMLISLFKAMEQIQKNVVLLVKINPNCERCRDFEDLLRFLNNKSSKYIRPIDVSSGFGLYDLISISNVVYFLGGTIAYEAMILGRPSIVYDYMYSICHNPVTEHPDSCVVVGNVEDLCVNLKKIMEDRMPSFNFNQALSEMFGLPQARETLLSQEIENDLAGDYARI